MQRTRAIQKAFSKKDLENPITKESYIEAMEHARRMEESVVLPDVKPLKAFLENQRV